MRGTLYILKDKIGQIDFKITDESMGAIGGILIPSILYKNYRSKIQDLTERKGIANIDDFPISIRISDDLILNAEGGIGITDVLGIDEIYVEAAGIDFNIIKDKI